MPVSGVQSLSNIAWALSKLQGDDSSFAALMGRGNEAKVAEIRALTREIMGLVVKVRLLINFILTYCSAGDETGKQKNIY